MSRDYGARFDDRGAPWGWITAAGCCLLGLVTIGLVLGALRYTAITKAQAWAPAGAPCPTVSQQAYLTSGYPATSTSDFDGLRFTRSYGYVNCAEIGDNGGRSPNHVPVCQFNDPGALALTTPRGRFYYLPRYKPMTVVVSRGQPSCVLAANLGPDRLRN